MTPVKQDKFEHNFKYGGGNCLQACVASFLDLPLEAVPHFMVFSDLYWEAFCLYMRSQNYDVYGYVPGEPPHDDRYHIVSIEVGKKDFSHSAIMKNGKIEHDPHPVKRKPSESVAGYYKIEKVTKTQK
jgi:hypothetical protein